MRLTCKVLAIENVFVHPSVKLKDTSAAGLCYKILYWIKSFITSILSSRGMHVSAEGGGMRSVVFLGAGFQVFEEAGYMKNVLSKKVKSWSGVSASLMMILGLMSGTIQKKLFPTYIFLSENIKTGLIDKGRLMSHHLSRHAKGVKKFLSHVLFLDKIQYESIFNLDKIVGFLYGDNVIKDPVIAKQNATIHFHATRIYPTPPQVEYFEYKDLLKRDLQRKKMEGEDPEIRKKGAKASMTFPFMVKEESEINGKLYLDGGVKEPLPYKELLKKVVKRHWSWKKFKFVLKRVRANRCEDILFIRTKGFGERSENYSPTIKKLIEERYAHSPKLIQELYVHHKKYYDTGARYLERQVTRHAVPNTSVIYPDNEYRVQIETNDIDEIMVGHFNARRTFIKYLKKINHRVTDQHEFELSTKMEEIYTYWARRTKTVDKLKILETLSNQELIDYLIQYQLERKDHSHPHRKAA
jgi:hypothetical protein